MSRNPLFLACSQTDIELGLQSLHPGRRHGDEPCGPEPGWGGAPARGGSDTNPEQSSPKLRRCQMRERRVAFRDAPKMCEKVKHACRALTICKSTRRPRSDTTA